MPCPAGGAPEIIVDQTGPYMVVDPHCADPKDIITINGYNFEPE
jgi:hypothetical protein